MRDTVSIREQCPGQAGSDHSAAACYEDRGFFYVVQLEDIVQRYTISKIFLNAEDAELSTLMPACAEDTEILFFTTELHGVQSDDIPRSRTRKPED
jgi:hypothetical protein